MSKAIIKFLADSFNTSFVAISVAIFSLLRLPSVIEPYWYGDEGIYEVIGKAISSGRMLYLGIWDNKPPVLYLIYAIFNGEQFYVRLASLLVGSLSVVVFFFLAKKLFTSRTAVVVATMFYSIFFGLPLLEGNIANAENFMVLPILLAFYVMVSAPENKKLLSAAIAGFLLSLAFLIKIVAIFDFTVLAIIVFIARFTETISFSKRNIKKELRAAATSIQNEAVLAISFAVPIIFTGLYFISVGAFPDFWRAAMSQNVGYVGYGNYFLFPMGLLFVKLILLVFSFLLVLRYRKTLGAGGVLIFLWLAFSMFNAFFSARPYTHYLLVLLPAFSLFLGYLLDNKKLLFITIPLLIIILFFVDRDFKITKRKILPYYVNYVKFIAGGSVIRYQAFFDKNTPRDYEIARFIRAKTSRSDNIFLWGDNAQIYALSEKLPPGRYTVAYHVTFYPDGIEETKAALRAASPKYIIDTKRSPEINNFLANYSLRYTIEDVQIYEKQP